MRPGRCLIVALCLVLPATAQAASYADIAPNEPENFTWIEEGVLGLGGGGLDKADVDTVESLGFRAIANFRAEHEDPADHIRAKGMEYLYMPVDHAVDMNATQLADFVEWMRAQRDAGRAAYVHCTNGWHRAAAFSAAWLMAENGMSADDAFERVRELRGGWAINRAPSALLAYDARLRGEPALDVLLLSPVARPASYNETMPATVEVLANGKPAAGASVHVWSEESSIDIRGHTGADGRLAFTYTPPPQGMRTDHVYARASLDGYMDGAANVELFYFLDVPTSRPLDIEARLVPDGVEVRVTKNGFATPARIMATTADGAFAFDATHEGQTTLPLDHAWQPVEVRAEAWGTLGGTARVEPPPVAPIRDRGLNEQPVPPWDVPVVDGPDEPDVVAPGPATDAAIPSAPAERMAPEATAALVAIALVALLAGSVAAARRL